MSESMIVYGQVVDQGERARLEADCAEFGGSLCWHDKPEMFSPERESSEVLVDLDDPRFSSPEFLLSISTAGKKVKLIGKAKDSDLDVAVRFSKLGVSEILTADQCLDRLNGFAEGLSRQVESDSDADSGIASEALVGRSPQMLKVRQMIDLLAEVDFPSALILGETGTGKSLISKLIHNSGVRARHNLVEVNCSAIPDELFESELFGHVKGAFTDAKTDKIGLFEYADNGTLFLDEVGNLSAMAQAKLLKIVEDRRLRKVGAVDEKDINVRVVAATNSDLSRAIEDGCFRRDLYFRLNLITLEIPPLRERPDDIPPLIDHYLRFYSTIYNKGATRLDQAGTEILLRHDWPGNVRELCNVIERAVLLGQSSKLGAKDIGAALRRDRVSVADRKQIVIDVSPQGVTLDEVEQQVVKQVLDLCNWNKTQAAQFLGVSRPRLRRLIASAGLEQNRRRKA